METKELRQIFKNKFDCYTSVDNSEGFESEIAMSEDVFVETVKSLLFGVVRQSEQLKKKHKPSFPFWMECNNIKRWDNNRYMKGSEIWSFTEISQKYIEEMISI